MTADWKPSFVLPNIPLLAVIYCDIAILATSMLHVHWYKGYLRA